MSKNTNLSFLTDYITADITNGRIGINNASPAYAFDVTGIARTSTSTYLATASGNVGIGTTGADQKLVINQGATSTGQGIPATTGTTQNGILRLRPAVGVYGETLDFGMNVSSTYGWIQATNSGDLATNYALALNPNGGNVGIGTSSPAVFVEISKNQNASTITRISNTTSGTGAYSALHILSSAAVYLYNFSNAYTTSGKFAAGTFLMDISTLNGININTSQSAPILFSTTDAERMRITSGGSLLMAKDAAIGINTSDGSDNGYLALCGASGDGPNRGGHIYLSGNERVSDPGSVVISAGNVIGTGSFIFFRTAGTEKVRIVGSGNVIIGSTSDNGYKLQVTGSIYATGSIVANSDIILKKNILKIENALEKIKQISGYTYEFKADDSKRHAGVIAQEIQKVLPEIVNKGDDGILGVEYGNMSALLIEAIKELSAEITILKNK